MQITYQIERLHKIINRLQKGGCYIDINLCNKSSFYWFGQGDVEEYRYIPTERL